MRVERYDTAIEDFNRAASIYAEQGDSRSEIPAFQEMADMYRLAKETDRALDIYARLLDLFEKLQDTEAKARTLTNMGFLQARMASYDDALATFREALAISERLGKPLHMAAKW